MELPVTKEQANYLNTVARIARLYRLTNERITEDLQDNKRRVSRGLTPEPIRNQDMADIVRTAGQLDALESTLFMVFPFAVEPKESREAMDAAKIHEATVTGYFKAAMNLDGLDYILMKH